MKIGVADIEKFLAKRPADKAPEAVLHPGDIVGGWTVEAFLASGRTSEVFRVVSVKDAMQGALKLLVDRDPALRDRFFSEIEILDSLDIGSVPRILAKGEYKGMAYYVMEYLHPVLFPLRKKEAFRINISLAKAVGELHASGYVHRDIKPANILLRTDGEVVLADMGLAVPAPGEDVFLRADSGDGAFAVGTPDFAAPEQLIKGVYGEREDVFSLGKVLRYSFEGKLPGRIAPVARKATENAPEDRYRSAVEYADALEKAVGANKRSYFAVSAAALLAFCAFAAFRCARRAPDAERTKEHSVPPTVPAVMVTEESTARAEGEDDASYFERMLPVARHGNVDAQNAVAEAYFHGKGTAKNGREAFAWYSKAAEKGHLGATASLGLCNMRGIGCEKNPEAAVTLFLSAAEKGHFVAMTNLAWCYLYGCGTETDRRRGFHWALRAAEKGHGEAQAIVGECYLVGMGTDRDVEAAAMWLERAAGNNVARAKKKLDEMRSMHYIR